jgi:transcription initiation factor TFIIE subunit alpha
MRFPGNDAVMAKSMSKEISEIIGKVVGEDVLPVVTYLQNRKNISEFKIAESIKQEVNTTRNMLYRLHTHNLVTYTRKKDRQKGWYISYWTFNKSRIKDLRKNTNIEEVDKLKERLEKEELNQNSYFICPSFCMRLDFDEATNLDYKCPECGQLLKHQDNTKTISNIKDKLKELERRKN